MEHPRIARKAASHGMLHTRYSQSRGPAYDPYSGRLLQGPRRAQENRGPRPAAPAVESMLKTTTETGDIGIFSINPSRTQRPPPKQPSLQQLKAWKYSQGHSDLIQYPPSDQYRNRDDRRRLPSYNRGITPAEVISLYETGSQKSSVSSRVQEEPEYRSYSMTHTSHSSYTLSNHKSYTSLRSQPDPQLQRPRSPFPYPTRLKRPGFRSSSPVLTDGTIDYSRRAEIERIPAVPYVNGNSSSSSPSSLYAQKRLPHLRIDSSKPTPSMLGPSSPIPRQNSPASLEDTHKRAHYRTPKKKPLIPEENSPTRSTYSFSSTVNLYQAGPPASATTTPGRVPPPSPKYYDYTEDFYPEEQLQLSPTEPPPPFQLERTIHEDRPLSANWSKSGPVEVPATHTSSSYGKQVNPSINETTLQSVENGRLSIRPPVPDKDLLPCAPEKPAVDQYTRSSTIDSLEHIVQMYENNRNPSHPLNPGPSLQERLEKDHSAWSSLQNSFDLARDEHILDISTESRGLKEEIKTHLSNRSLVCHWMDDSEEDTNEGAQNTFSNIPPKTIGDMVASHLKPSPHPSYDVSMIPLPNDERYNSKLLQRSTSSQSIRFRSSKLIFDGTGLQGLAQMLANYQAGSGPAVPPKQQDSSIRRAITTTNPVLSRKHLNNLFSPLPHPSRPVGQAQNGTLGSVSNYSHHIQSESSREVPMLAPKPISPARQLKLKNSIPQLMKALPTLPKDQKDDNIMAFSPPSRQTSVEITLPFRFSPLFLESRTNTNPNLEPDKQSNARVYQIAAQPTTPPPPPKLKLRRRPSSSYRPKSSNSSQPWNLDENYPWTDQAPNVHLPSLIKDEPIVLPKRPKFKLRVSRPPKTSFGTILINKDARAPKKQVLFDLQNHNDLFTPHNGLDHMFRGMKRHFSSRKISASSQNAEAAKFASSITLRSRSHENLSTSREVTLRALTPNLQTPTETRSFFSDDSSHMVNHSLRDRLSHLRAKLPVPYVSKTGAHSYDDILWRERSVAEKQLMVRTRLNLDTVDVNDTDNAESLENARSHRLRAKVSGWLEKARTAMASVVKTGRATDKRQRKMYSGV